MSISEKEKQLIVELCKGIGNLQTTVLTTRACQIAEYLRELPGTETTHAGIVHERDAAQDRERQLREALQHIAKHADDPVTREIARAALAASPAPVDAFGVSKDEESAIDDLVRRRLGKMDVQRLSPGPVESERGPTHQRGCAIFTDHEGNGNGNGNL